MKLTDADILELHELCGALCDDRLTNTQEARLSHFLKTSEEARTLYFRQMALTASLAEYAGEMQLEAPDQVPLRSLSVSHAWIFGLLAAAACVVLTLVLWKPRQERTTVASTAEEWEDAELQSGEYVARVTGVKDCVWQDGVLQPGEALTGGRQLHLQKGLAEITFDSGAQLRLEGPASLDIISAWEATLEKGGLKATVPAQAIGFRLHHNSVEVVDLGTEFSMIADSSGDAEVHVLKGSVEVSPLVDEDPAPVVLHESETRRFGKHRHNHSASFEARHRQLAQKAALERWKQPADFAHWSFDELKEGTFPAQTEGLTGAFNAGSADQPLTDGRWGQALHLDGRHHMSLTMPGLSHASSRAVAFWVRVPKDAELSQAQAVLAWPMRSKKFGNRMLEIGWNRNPNQGPLGALRTELGRAYAIGATPLRDGVWHHIAVIFVPVGHDGTLQVTQYVDGRLEGTTLKAIKVKQLPTEDTDADVVWLGRSFAKHAKSRKPFRGDIDELFITDRALSPSEIVQIMTQNSLHRIEISATDGEMPQVAADF